MTVIYLWSDSRALHCIQPSRKSVPGMAVPAIYTPERWRLDWSDSCHSIPWERLPCDCWSPTPPPLFSHPSLHTHTHYLPSPSPCAHTPHTRAPPLPSPISPSPPLPSPLSLLAPSLLHLPSTPPTTTTPPRTLSLPPPPPSLPPHLHSSFGTLMGGLQRETAYF